MNAHEFTRDAHHHTALAAEIQRRRDWGSWTATDRPADIIDLSERFAPRCEPEPPKLDREPESEFERQIAALLAERPPQWLEYAFWGALLGLWAFVMLAICVLLAQ
jgi:hypothetical protein